MQNEKLKNTILAAMFIAAGIILPFLTGQLKQIGNMLLPMHIPVFLCGLICGWQYGLAVGFITPLLRTFLFGMPPMPSAVSMAFELATYGFTAGFIYSHLHNKSIKALYTSLISAMICGRLIRSCVQAVILGYGMKAFSYQMFIAGGFLNAIPGIVIQLILIPIIITTIKNKEVDYD